MTEPKYSLIWARKIYVRMAAGESLDAICADKDMPSKATVMEWLATKPSFRRLYALARELRADGLFEEILTIADGAPDGSEKSETAQRARLRIDARKALAARLSPAKYADRAADKPETSDKPVIIRVVTGVPRAGDLLN
jgi:hypothetical protein